MVDSGAPSSSVYASEAYFNQLLAKAVAAKASDIHLKVGIPPAARVRGELVFFRTEPLRKEDTDSIARLVIKDGRIRSEVPSLREHDCAYAADGVGRFRVNVYRQRGTLGIVMRSIPTKIPSFEDLGAPAPCQYLAERERGLVLVVGAAGNGKSSTLAAMIGHLNRTQPLHIVTIEDPIEFLHEDDKSSISQREVGIDTGTFADALRAALRQDPDVILVGEIRDELTLDIALKAAETGHLVLSTLHTNDAPATISRLLNMGVEPFLITASVNLVLAQRLARKVCVDCRQPIQIEPQALQELGFTPDQVNIAQGRLVKGFGCRTCNGTGYKGRVALYEVMRFNDTLKEMVLQGSSTAELKAAAIKQGMVTLRMAGIMKVLDGVTTTEEILRVTMSD